MLKKSLQIILFTLLCSQTFAQPWRQPERNNSGSVLLANFNYNLFFPANDMSARFGQGFAAGISIEWMTAAHFIFGVQGKFLFGNKVKEDVLSGLRNDDGLIFSDDLGISNVQLGLRGWSTAVFGGKIFPLSSTNRSGLKMTLGAGFLQHKIRIKDEPLTHTSLISGSYTKGYDRLSNGLAMTQFVGYQHLANDRRLNFTVGLELTEGFTQNRRSLNFDTRQKDETRRFDLLIGIHLGWTLPFFVGENPDEIRY